jgi:ParB family chromosome partitioning protein
MAYEQLADEFSLTQKQIAQRVGKSRAAVTNTLRLLKAARPVREALLEETISEGHARAILGLETMEAQAAALKTVLKRDLNVRQTEELVRKMLGHRQEKRQETRKRSPEVEALETRFRESLGTKVRLNRKDEGGRLVIYFYSDEELEALYEQIVGKES